MCPTGSTPNPALTAAAFVLFKRALAGIAITVFAAPKAFLSTGALYASTRSAKR